MIRDAAAIRFHTRMTGIFRLIGYISVATSVFVFAQTENVALLLIGPLLGLFCIFSPYYEKDAVQLFVVCHPSLIYAGATLIYGMTHGNFMMSGLVDISLAFTVVLTYQIAILFAYIVARVLVAGLRLPKVHVDTAAIRRPAVIAIISFAAYVLGVTEIVKVLQATSQVFVCVFLLAVGSITISASRSSTLILASASIALLFMVSLAINERTTVFTSILFWGVYFVFSSDKIFTRKTIVLSILAFLCINWISFSFTTARNEVAEKLYTDVVGRTFDLAFSYEGLANALPFLPAPERPGTFSSRSGRYYSVFIRTSLFGAPSDYSAFARLALIAHMDIVTGRIGEPTNTNWNAIQALFTDWLPGVGQVKEQLTYSDRVVWDLGLRGRESFGAPLITPAGELFTMGGYGAVFWTSLLFYTVMFIEFRILRYLIGYSWLYIGGLFTMVYAVTVTGTALGLSILAFRSLPLLVVILVALRSQKTHRDRSGVTRAKALSFHGASI